ncbi:MAG: HupE/UreJ family protein [Methylocystaceae bacterium]|nr:HupE/UreJ family protein [Methylocystaceae bacterium]
MKRSFFFSFFLTAIAALPALAHTGVGEASSLSSGFGHPIGGLDHILAMVAVGILAAQQGGKAIYLIPASFIVMMIFGGVMGVSGVALPFVEIGIMGSVIVLGAVIALGRQFTVPMSMALVGFLSIFHGHAHGTEMPLNASGMEYGLGFIAATALLHLAGLGLSLLIAKIDNKITPLAIRASGSAIAVLGVVLFVI